MPPKGVNNLTPEARAQAIADYQAGSGLYATAAKYHVAAPTLRTVLIAENIHVRSRAEQNRLEALRQHDSLVRQISRDRLYELHWGPEKLGQYEIARRLGELAGHRVSPAHVAEVYRDNGISMRSAAEQLKIDGMMGRRAEYGNFRPGSLPEEQKAEWAAKLSAAQKGRRKTREHLRKLGLAHRKSETRSCAWCGKPVTRKPCYFRVAPADTVCCVSDGNRLRAWRRHNPNSPRPLIVHALRQLIGSTYPNEERLQRLAESVGAGEAEIIEALLEL